jgi:N-acetylmuramoyl-L-alanine amidase
MIFISKYSPNFSRKMRKNKDIRAIVIHYTGMQSKIASIKRLLSSKHKVSCHYLIDRKGKIFKMIAENRVAWHAGKSKWKNIKNLNKNSVGIELVNKGHEHGYQKFTTSQINQLIKLCLILKRKYKIKNSHIVGHSDIAPLRKQDPGEKFPWKKLKEKNLGFWFKNVKFKNKKYQDKKVKELFFKNILKIGYRYFSIKKRNKEDLLVVKAFQRRFLQNNVTGKIDLKTYKISHFLASQVKN